MRIIQILLALAALAPTTAAQAEPTPRVDGSAWRILSLDGKTTAGAPRLEFVRGQVIGSTGCNGFEGSYVRRGEVLTFHQLTATEMACERAIAVQERALLALLGQSVQMRSGPKGRLRLSGRKHVAVLVRSASCVNCNRPAPPLPAPSVAGKSWAILSLNGRAVSQPGKARISFTGDQLSATVGCNQMGGVYRIEKGAYIVARQLMSTLIGCLAPLDEEERLLYAVLGRTPVIERVRTSDPTLRIRLTSRGNEAVLELRR